MARSDWNDLSLEAARTTHRAAATKLRDADIKNIRNLVLSVNSAVGRLSECFSWKTENQCEDYLCGFTRCGALVLLCPMSYFKLAHETQG